MDIPYLTASQLAPLLASRRLSPVELVETLIARARTLDPRVHAFITLDEEGARLQARAAEAEIAAGRSRGPLHGIPVALKDNIDVRHVRTTCHSRLMLDNVASRDAYAVERLRAAGAVILGKLATWEFAIGGPSEDLPFPGARNPWKAGHIPGGSSSGSGAGLAAGFFPLSLGTDTGGSVRHPAGACGVVGLKPTYGRVSRQGVFPLAFTLDHVGPMARSVADIAMLLDCIAGHDPADPSSVAVPSSGFATQLDRGVRGVRIGFVRHFHEEDMIGDPEMVAALEDGARVFRSLGAEVRDVRLPPLKQFSAVNRIILNSEAWPIHKRSLQQNPGHFGQIARRRLMTGAFIPAADYVMAQRSRHILMAALRDVFREVDVLLAINMFDPAAEVGFLSKGSPVNLRQARTPFNVTGNPAISVMSGLSGSGLPLSLQLIGRPFDEAHLLRVAAAFEAETAFHRMKPPMDGPAADAGAAG